MLKGMAIQQVFRSIDLAQLIDTSKQFKEDGYRLAQLHPVLERDDSITLFYTFVKDAEVVNIKVPNIQKGATEVPSVTELFRTAFVFENEAHDLFGVNVVGNVLDFKGKFYAFAEGVEAPMTIISQEQLAAREKAAKVAAAKAARAAKASNAQASQTEDDIEKKLAGMDPEKAAKVRAAMEAKAKKAAEAEKAKASEDLEAKLAAMDPEKAAKVRAAMEAKAKKAGSASAELKKEGE